MSNYKEEDLKRLHEELLCILDEIIRVCNVLKIPYFIIGGTAIGAFFHRGFIPWDDDIDLGMTRNNYKRFIKEAPSVISRDFFVQSFETEEKTPFYFMKVRKTGTLFVEEPYKDIPMHQGIFVDIFPFDHVPDSLFWEKIHRRVVQYCEGCFKRRQVYLANLERFSFLPEKLAIIFARLSYSATRLLPRSFYYHVLCGVQSFFNKKKCKYISIVKMPLDQISAESVRSCGTVLFEGRQVKAPVDLETYLWHHYPHLNPWPPVEQRINHAPFILSFGQK